MNLSSLLISLPSICIVMCIKSKPISRLIQKITLQLTRTNRYKRRQCYFRELSVFTPFKSPNYH